MKLYYMPGACSQASNIALREAGLTFELVKVDRHTKKAADGLDFNEVNPKGYVPALTLDSGETLTENLCVLQYIADRNPAAKLAPAFGTMERYRLIEALAFISPKCTRASRPCSGRTRPRRRVSTPCANLIKRLDYVEKSLLGRPAPPDGTAVHHRRLLPRGGAQLGRPREARSGQVARA